MKKLVLLLFVALISIQISAQEFHFIPRIGFNLANTYPESFADMRPGVNVGAYKSKGPEVLTILSGQRMPV